MDQTGSSPAPSAEAYEQAHVHGVYEAIAPHFSATRHKPWPLVASFLAAQRPGAVGYDVGCGNGKYLGVNGDVALLGCDRSAALVALARGRVAGLEGRPEAAGRTGGEEARGTAAAAAALGAEAVVADVLAVPLRGGRADFVISVAVVHHLSTRERRVEGIRQLLQCLRPDEAGDAGDARPGRGGAGEQQQQQQRRRRPWERAADRGRATALVFVWALEQGSSRRGWDESGEQDLLVPWVMKAAGSTPAPSTSPRRGGGGGGDGGGGQERPRRNRRVQQQGPQGQRAGPPPSGGGSDKSGEQPHHASATAPAPTPSALPPPHTDKTFQRYYHLYRKGELEGDVVAAGGEVLDSGYERDNWWVVAAAATTATITITTGAAAGRSITAA